MTDLEGIVLRRPIPVGGGHRIPRCQLRVGLRLRNDTQILSHGKLYHLRGIVDDWLVLRMWAGGRWCYKLVPLDGEGPNAMLVGYRIDGEAP